MKTKELNLEVIRTKCNNCGIEYERYKLSDFLYGERLFITNDGHDYIYMNTFEDSAFDEVANFIDKYYENKNVSNTFKTECFNKVLGLTFDTVYGKTIDTSRIHCCCKKFNSENIESFSFNPPKDIKTEIPIVTHDEWNKKSKAEKQELIYNKLKEVCF